MARRVHLPFVLASLLVALLAVAPTAHAMSCVEDLPTLEQYVRSEVPVPDDSAVVVANVIAVSGTGRGAEVDEHATLDVTHVLRGNAPEGRLVVTIPLIAEPAVALEAPPPSGGEGHDAPRGTVPEPAVAAASAGPSGNPAVSVPGQFQLSRGDLVALVVHRDGDGAWYMETVCSPNRHVSTDVVDELVAMAQESKAVLTPPGAPGGSDSESRESLGAVVARLFGELARYLGLA